MFRPAWRSLLGKNNGGCDWRIWICWQGAPLDSWAPEMSICIAQLLSDRNDFNLLRLLPGIVIGQLQAQLTCEFTFAVESLPEIIFSSTRRNHLVQVDPGLADQICAFVLTEDGDFEVVVIRRVVYGESKFLIPVPRC